MTEDTKKKPQRRSLLEYERAKRKGECQVCTAVSPELLMEMQAARKRKVSQDDVLDWLKDDYGITLSRDDMMRHGAAHHEKWLETPA